jgi:hypothetical protein
MSDGGFDVDEHVKKRRGKTQLRSPVFNKRTGNLVSFPDIPPGEEESIPKKDLDSVEPQSVQDKSSTRNSIPTESISVNEKLLLKSNIPAKALSVKKNQSFSARLKEGWTKEQLMKHYALSESEYDQLVTCLEQIQKEK